MEYKMFEDADSGTWWWSKDDPNTLDDPYEEGPYSTIEEAVKAMHDYIFVSLTHTHTEPTQCNG